MTLKEAIEITNNNILHQRRLLTILSSKTCKKLFDESESKPHIMVEFRVIFETESTEKLRYWLKRFLDPELGELGVRDLRKLASAHQIPLYYRLTKLELIQGLNHARNKSKDRKNKDTSPENVKIDTRCWSGTEEI